MPADLTTDDTIVTSRPTVVGSGPAPCPKTPNCVSSKSTDPVHHIAPIPFLVPVDAARERLLAVLRALPRTRIVAAEPRRVRVEFRTLLCRFVDDAEFFFDEAQKVIELRSASRVGRYDFGVNRRRLERVRGEFLRRERPEAPPAPGVPGALGGR